jgi:hypothetical protein
MKIALFDPYNGKFTREMQLWWQARGDEVRFSQYYNPANVIWADLVWFDTGDNNLMSGTNPSSAILDDASNFSPWDMHDMDLSEKRVIVRAIDIEVWQGHLNGVKWDVVDELIFIADHIRTIVDENELNMRRENMGVHTIECGVAIDKWNYREHQKGFNIAVVGERWMSKGEAYVLQIAMKLKELDPRYKIHWLGQRSDYQWEHAYFDEFIEHFNLPIEITNYADSVDEFLEDKDYILSASHKEAFGYNIAEGMAKGLKPVIHRFYGADKLWPGLTWNTIDEAVEMITEDKYDSASYRQYLIDHEYTMDQMMRRIDKIIKGEYK